MIIRAWKYIKASRYKKTMILAMLYSWKYRMQIKLIAPKKLEKNWGVRDEESAETEERESYYVARSIAYAVERTCKHTPWESKCLVRALTAQRLLKRKHIASTLYLGCKLDEGKMVAHAWLRCGRMYVTGGNGDGYGVVSKFRA